MPIIVFSFFLIFMYQMAGGIMVANVVYYALFLYNLVKYQSIKVNSSGIKMALFLVFTIWAIISTVVYSLEYRTISLRNIVQLVFTLQYFIFVIDLDLNLKDFEAWLFRFSIVLSLAILILYIATGQFMYLTSLFTTGRLWGAAYIPGWPNTTPIPLLFGLWISFRQNKSFIYKLFIIMALFLTTSRAALLGIAAIIAYFIVKKYKESLFKFVFALLPLVALIVFYFNDILNLIFQIVPSLKYRLSVSYDRIDIMYTTMHYVSKRPLLGFGSNSLDQVIDQFGNVSRYNIKWEHTHNWVLDILLRYGAIGLTMFTAFIGAVLLKIKDRDKQFLFFLILVLSLFQTYMRNFCILFLLVYLTMEETSDNETMIEDKS